MMVERKNNRGKIQIMGDILGLATSGIKKTHIMYRGNLSYEQAHQYILELISKGLVDRDTSSEGTVYRTTDKGREFLYYYNRIIESLDDKVAYAPYVTSQPSEW